MLFLIVYVDTIMYIRLVKAKSGNTIRRYAQLVQSYRRKDGMPAQKVVASLGQLSDREVENLRLALEASRKGRTVVLPETDGGAWKTKISANLAFLDIAVAHHLWRSWQLSSLLNRLIPGHASLVPASEIIAALTIQRCVAPASKLSAERWFPKTALPELLDIDPDQFNNSRIHRVLGQLDQVEKELQEALPKRYKQRDGSFASLFVDCTDTWFEGRGCDQAERGTTKEGLRNRYKVGILLLCTEQGYPLRWKILGGRIKDPKALTGLVEELEEVSWAKQVPIIFDRAMGTASAVSRLVDSGLMFLTATRRSEIGSYTEALPTDALADIAGSEDESEHPLLEAQAIERVVKAGMSKVNDRLFVLDLGRCERLLPSPMTTQVAEDETISPDLLEGGAVWLWCARDFQRLLDEKVHSSRSEIAAAQGISRARMTQIMNLLRLDETLQHEVLAGCFGYIPDRTLRRIANLGGKAQQRRALEEHGATARAMAGSARPPKPRKLGRRQATFRLVAYFNPQMFVDQRTTAERHLRQIEDFAADLNRRLNASKRTRTVESVHVELSNKLASYFLLSVYRVEVAKKGDHALSVRLHFNENAWARRRRFDGFVLLVAHPELSGDAEDIVQLYRNKDMVEKDFRTIKTDLKLRPVFHHTDPKVRAHITLCVLALLLERTLEVRLRRMGQPLTAPACFEEFSSGCLNMVSSGPDGNVSYVMTEVDESQRSKLRGLRMLHLADQQEVAAKLHPRPQK